MSRLRLPLRRRRGGSYTVIVLASSILILATSSVLLRATGHAYSLTALDYRRTQSREAVFAGVRWAEAHANRVGPESASVTLNLSSGPVRVRCERDGRVLKIESEATGVDLVHTLKGRVAPDDDDRYALASFTLESRAAHVER